MFTKIKNSPVCYLAGKMWRFSEGRRGWVVLTVILSTAGLASSLAVPLVMEQGKIVEQGTLRELLSTQSKLSAMWAEYSSAEAAVI